jgi:hypothetical protein
MEFCASERKKSPTMGESGHPVADSKAKGAAGKAEERGRLIDGKATDSATHHHDDEDDIQPKWFQTSVGTIGNHSVFTTFVAGFIFSDLTVYGELDLPYPMGAVYLTLTTLAAAIFLGSSLLSIFTLIAIDRTYSIAHDKPTAKVKQMLDAFGPYEPEKMRKPERYTPSVHIFRSTKIRKHLAIAVAPGAVATRATHARACSGSRDPLAEERTRLEGEWSTKTCAPLVLRSPRPVHGGLGD